MTEATANRALGLHHTLSTAVADLIDNSVDAGAEHVLVRFIQEGRHIVGLRVVDDGRGMDERRLDAAVRYGVPREYRPEDHGHFGVGLKAASLSQANGLTVYSRADGHDPAGRRLTVSGRADVPVVEALATVQVARECDSAAPRFPFITGTIIEWRGIRTFPLSATADEQGVWLEATISDLQFSLGLVFHRLIERGLRISIDVFDSVVWRAGAPRSVRSISPFGYRRSGHPDHPRRMPVVVGSDAQVVGHLWPARSSAPEYRLGGMPGRDAQGFYVYRNDRLLQAGGWLGVLQPRPEWALARIEVDIDPVLAEHITINPEKSGVVIDATLSAALHTTLTANGYLDAAANLARTARRVARRPIAVVEPGRGLPDTVADEFADSFSFVQTADPVDIGWRVLANDQFFEVDLAERVLWLNARFRRRLGNRGSDVDAPLIRTLVYLLTQDMFDALRHSSRQLEQMQAWQQVLIAALAADNPGGDR